MELIYDVDVKASLDDLRKTGMERYAIDFSVNKNRWQVPDTNIDYFASMLQETQIRVNRREKVETIKGDNNISLRFVCFCFYAHHAYMNCAISVWRVII